MRYTQQQLETLLGTGKWWNVHNASRRIGNISQENLLELLRSLPQGIEGVVVQNDPTGIWGGNPEFYFTGTAEEMMQRIKIDMQEFRKIRRFYEEQDDIETDQLALDQLALVNKKIAKLEFTQSEVAAFIENRLD